MNAMPLCFIDQRVFKLWSSSAGAADCGSGPCHDCQPGYQLRMKKQGRCAHPETMFGVTEDGGVYGFWPK